METAAKAKGGQWPGVADVIGAMVGLSVESLGGKGSWRKDHIADQTFVQGFSTHNNKFDFVTLDPARIETMYSADLQKPAGADFWDWLKTAQFKFYGPCTPMSGCRGFGNVLLGGVFHAAVLFLVAAGLQLVFGVQKIVNLACGSFYALGAYFGITLVNSGAQGRPAALDAAADPDRCRPARWPWSARRSSVFYAQSTTATRASSCC